MSRDAGPATAPAERGGSVTVAGVLALAVNSAFAFLGLGGSVISAWVAYGSADAPGGNGAAIGFLITSVIVLALAVAGIGLSVLVLRRVAYARWITVALFSVYGLVAGLFLVVGGSDPYVDTGTAVVVGAIPLVVCVAIVSLLLSPRAYDEFAPADTARED